jgi:von Willebrand factor type A domain
MKNKKTYYHLVLDKSGSMASCWHPTIVGFSNQMVKINQLAKQFPEQEFYVSLCVFDNEIRFVNQPENIQTNPNLNLENIRPGGATALFDAIGESIRQLEFTAGKEISNDEASVVMVILTDGHENASSNYSSSMILEKMEVLRKTDKWSFAFIGTDFDITQTANAFRAGKGNSLNMSKAAMGAVFDRVNNSLFHYAQSKKGGNFKQNFFDEDDLK